MKTTPKAPPRGKAYPTKTAPEWNPPTPYTWDADGKPLVTAKNHAVLLEEMRVSAKRLLPERRSDPSRAPTWAATSTNWCQAPVPWFRYTRRASFG